MFDTDREGVIYFEKYLSTLPTILTFFVVDIAQEEFRIEIMPALLGKDRKHYINRKVKRFFPHASHSYNKLLSRQKTLRKKEDKILLSALNLKEGLTPWIDRCVTSAMPIVGIYSIAHLSERLLPCLPQNTPYTLLVNIQAVTGLRLSFFIEQKLTMSRLLMLPLPSQQNSQDLSQTIFDESEKMVRYLETSHFIPQEGIIHVFFATAGKLAQNLSDKTIFLDNYHLVDLPILLEKIGSSGIQLSQYADQIFVQLIMRKRNLKNIYATRKERKNYFMICATRLLYSIAFYCFILTAAGSSYLLWKNQKLNQEVVQLKKSTAQLLMQYEAIIAMQPAKITLSGKTMEEIVQTDKILTLQQQSIFSALNNLSYTFKRNHNFFLLKKVTVSMESAGQKKQDEYREENIKKLHININIDGELKNNKPLGKKTLLAWNVFIEDLKKDFSTEQIIIKKAPITINPQTAITSHQMRDTDKKEFSLTIYNYIE